MKRTLLFAWIGTLFLTPALVLAEDVKPEAPEKPARTADSDLKERQTFNKLRRSTKNIYKVTMRSGVAYRLQTALGYVSTIDLPEPALKVFVGGPGPF